MTFLQKYLPSGIPDSNKKRAFSLALGNIIEFDDIVLG